MTSFEQACAETESAAREAAAASAALLRAARGLSRAAAEGDISRIRRSAERLEASLDVAGRSTAAAVAAWPLAAEAEEALLAGPYEEELIAAAAAAGMQVRRQDDRLLVSPTLLKVLPQQRAVQLDRQRSTALRPSRVVELLRARQQRRPRFAAERFIETLHAAYRLVAGADGAGGVPLARVYEALTLLPDVRRDYARADFSRDLFFLDRSGVTQTRAGARLSLPTATATRSPRRLFAFVAPDGEYVTYYGIRFSAPGAPPPAAP